MILLSSNPAARWRYSRCPLLVAVWLGLLIRLPTAEAASPVRLRVLCYNIHHGEGTDGRVDLPRLAQVIRAARPDLVALQEVDNQTRRTNGVDQTAELARLTDLHGRFAKQIDYEGGGYGQALLSRFPLSEVQLHVLPGMPPREQRLAGAVQVDVEGAALTFVTTHLHHINAEFRAAQAAKLNELFGQTAAPVILAGDLNATPDSEPLLRLSSVWTRATGKAPRLTYPAEKPIKEIDYVLVRPEPRFSVVSVEALDEQVASDHRPVLAVVDFTPDPK